ncbi:ABC transporter ATP-binding protein [Miltoncostaea marina]|uniref:ABC transporter ATP-binding protein n=1 Tax=Miltoncostaea marina TaxID=2843215 RepID=UPI001C3D9DB0|nr:ABC transporter ATP-binding protein [Miltoncostaea marina]
MSTHASPAPLPVARAGEGGPPPARRKLRRLAPYFRPYLGRAIATVVLMLIVTASGLAIPALAQYAIDHGIRAGDKGVLVLSVVLFVVAGGVGWLAGYHQSFLSSWVGERVLLDLRTETFRHLMRLELGYHERTPTGRTVSRLTSDIEALQQLVTDGVTSLVINGLTFIGVVVILFSYDAELALLTFVIFPALAVGTALFRVYSTRAYRRTRERVADVLATLQETLSGVRVVQGFGRQEPSERVFERVNEEYREANMATIRLSGVYFPGVELLSGVGTAIILYFGATRVLDQDLSVGVMVAFVGYLSSFFDPIQQLSQLYNTFQSAMAALEKIFGVLDTEPEVVDPPDAVELPRIAGDVELRGVAFAYDRVPVLRDIDLRIAAGETVALVGTTGAGKSTLAKLIARFYDPVEGRVLIDGHDLRHVAGRSLRDQLAVVPQEGHLFAGTIAENLAFGRPDATDDELRAAAEAVGAAGFIEALPEGYDTPVSDRGSGLSAGQRQLVSFARALVADPRLLILDEATSSVDLRAEQRIEEALRTLLADRTAIVIAHRLSTIRDADRIVVLEAGRVVEQGTHDELVRAGGRYAELYGDWAEVAGEAAPGA